MESLFIIDKSVDPEQNYRRMVYTVSETSPIYADTFQYNVLNQDSNYRGPFEVVNAVYATQDGKEASYIEIRNRWMNVADRARIYFHAAALDYWLGDNDVLELELDDTIETIKPKVAAFISVPEDEFTIVEYAGGRAGSGTISLAPNLNPGRLQLYLKPAVINCNIT